MTQYEIDLGKPMNGAQSLGVYNLLVTKRDMHLYCVGLKPNRQFKFNEVKKYFGLKGDKFKVSAAIRDMVNRLMAEKSL